VGAEVGEDLAAEQSPFVGQVEHTVGAEHDRLLWCNSHIGGGADAVRTVVRAEGPLTAHHRPRPCVGTMLYLATTLRCLAAGMECEGYRRPGMRLLDVRCGAGWSRSGRWHRGRAGTGGTFPRALGRWDSGTLAVHEQSNFSGVRDVSRYGG